jgi:DNA repair exonuclease SbcCD nuclease subunit
MHFQFIHAADLHLGSPFLGLASHDEEIAKRFSNASRAAFTELVTRAIDLKVAFVVIAGDVYDGDWKDTSIGLFFNREAARLDRAGIPLYLVKGNHDAESVVTKAVSRSLPEAVKVFPSTEPKTFRIEKLKIAIHGQSFPHRAVTENYALSYPEPVPGWFNLGVLHTSCDGRPNHDSYAPCSAADLATRNYEYWALGHVHEYEEVCRDPWIVFPGNLQGRSVRECGPKGAVLVEAEDGEVKDVQRLILDKARWAVAGIDIAGIEHESDVLHKIEEFGRGVVGQADDRLVALRIRIQGNSSLHRRLKANIDGFSDEIQAALHRVSEDVWLETVRVETSDLAAYSEDSALQSLDLAAMLEGVERDAAVREAAASELASLQGKLPAGVAADLLLLQDNDLDTLFAEARALVLGRAMS